MTPDSPALRRILEADLCAGCGLCAGISGGAIAMHISPEGYLRPRQDAPIPDDTDRLISELCPGISLRQDSKEGTDHVLWGPIIDARTGAATDPALRHHASSGGALSAILAHLLESGMVDRIIQTAASPAAPLENVTVTSLDREEIDKAAGSRYAPSAPLADLGRELDRPGRFALVGKPCDIAAARALGRVDLRVAEKIPVMLSFFCAGVPSLKGARQIVKALGAGEDEVARFRYRGDGWPGRATATLRDGRELSMSYADSWGAILSKHVQFRCKICPDGSGGFADIVCADAWQTDEKGYPLFEEQDGRSLILTRTGRGEEIVAAAENADRIATGQIDVKEIEKTQPSQARRKRLVLSRVLAMRAFARSAPAFVGLSISYAARSESLFANLRSWAGMSRRLLAGKHNFMRR
jgi:coenzyme F420 hydrogenase subunit beta